jgi:hypothetical protein
MCEEEYAQTELSNLMTSLALILDCNREKIKQYCQRVALDLSRTAVEPTRAVDATKETVFSSNEKTQVRLSSDFPSSRLLALKAFKAQDIVTELAGTAVLADKFSFDPIAMLDRRSYVYCTTNGLSFYVNSSNTRFVVSHSFVSLFLLLLLFIYLFSVFLVILFGYVQLNIHECESNKTFLSSNHKN